MQIQVQHSGCWVQMPHWPSAHPCATAGTPCLLAAAFHLLNCMPLTAQCPLTLLSCKSGRSTPGYGTALHLSLPEQHSTDGMPLHTYTPLCRSG